MNSLLWLPHDREGESTARGKRPSSQEPFKVPKLAMLLIGGSLDVLSPGERQDAPVLLKA